MKKLLFLLAFLPTVASAQKIFAGLNGGLNYTSLSYGDNSAFSQREGGTMAVYNARVGVAFGKWQVGAQGELGGWRSSNTYKHSPIIFEDHGENPNFIFKDEQYLRRINVGVFANRIFDLKVLQLYAGAQANYISNINSAGFIGHFDIGATGISYGLQGGATKMLGKHWGINAEVGVTRSAVNDFPMYKYDGKENVWEPGTLSVITVPVMLGVKYLF